MIEVTETEEADSKLVETENSGCAGEEDTDTRVIEETGTEDADPKMIGTEDIDTDVTKYAARAL